MSVGMQSLRMFPIQDAEAIPWAVIAPYDHQCQRNHGGQTLEKIAKRGGLGASEACDIILGLSWSTTSPAYGVHLLREIVKDHWYLPQISMLLKALRKYGTHELCKCTFGSRGERIPSLDCELDKILADTEGKG